MKVIVAILLGQLALSYALPLDSENHAFAVAENFHSPEYSSGSASASIRVSRAAVSKSSSEVGPDGKVKSGSLAAKTDDAYFGHAAAGGGVEPEHPSFPIGTEGPPPPDYPSHPGHSPAPEGDHHQVPEPTPVPTQGVPVQRPHHKGAGSFQNVAAKASMDKGTAIATAVNKRDTNFQQTLASGNVAISKTQNNKHTDGLSVQKAQSTGEKLAVATAENNGRVAKRDVSKNLQAVQAQGNKAIASASENKGSGLNVQKVAAIGGDLAVAKASSGESQPPPQGA